jgi:L-threonylcarbamoyladenylate synthase
LEVVGVVEQSAIRVSGSLEAHYAPAASVILDQSPITGQGFIAMADVVADEGVVRLAAPKTHEEFARVLYSALRAADEQGLETVVVEQPVGDGIAIAIRDRLKRAASIKSIEIA